MENVTVLMPVGPKPGHLDWIEDALQSVFAQTYPVKEIMLIDDQAHLSSQWIWNTFDIFPEGFHYMDTFQHGKQVWVWDNPPKDREIYVSLWETPWRLGFSAAFNCGMSLTMNDLVMYLGSDDLLGPDCVEDCIDAYHANNNADGWYAVSYEDEKGQVQDIPINAALITKGLWKFTGGFPPSAFVGPDALLLSCLMVHAPEKIVKVKPGKVNYYNREHPDQETRQASFFLDEMNSIRNKETNRFMPNPEWIK